MATKVSKWVRLVEELGPGFASRTARHDEDDSFVKESFDELKKHGVFAAGVPAELGGGGATHRELCEMLRRLAHHCSSTALALSMHTHLVATNAFRWRRDPAPFEKLLRRVAAEGLVLVSSGGSDWLPGSGRAERVEGGYRVTARKVFSSGSPAGDLLSTCAIDETKNEVIHFGVPLKHEAVRIKDNWRAHGMRGTGSNDVEIEGFFVPDAAIAGRRPAGKWGPLYHAVYLVAFPLVYSVYVGVAEAARDIAVAEVKRRGPTELSTISVGELETELLGAELAVEKMVSMVETMEPGHDATSLGVRCRTLAGEGAVRTVEKAIECVGGQAFFRKHPLERLWRDVQAARFHALQRMPQLRHSGRYALGLDLDA
jgi:alkylation response protein AidB-like acyl-CoA dehydrogenase